MSYGMQRPTNVLALACLFLVATGPAMVARSSAVEDVVTRTAEIPGTGLAVTLPAPWRTWLAEAEGRPTEVIATDVAAGGRCTFWSAEGVMSAESAADDIAETYRDRMVVERAIQTVPAGDAFRVSYRYEVMPDEPRFVFHDYFLDAGDGVARLTCSGVEAPGDAWLHIAEAIAPISTHAPASAPFDPRIEVPDHGLAVEFGDEWLVRAWPGDDLLLEGATVMRSDSVARDGVGSSSECWVEDETGAPSLSGLSSLDDWREAFVEAAEAHGQRTSVPAVTRADRLQVTVERSAQTRDDLTHVLTEPRKRGTQHVDLPPGSVVRADWRRFNGMPATAWVISDGVRRASLFCRSTEPPADRWLSIAETFEFLPITE